ncbi:MAG: hypothetical protein V3T33_00390 [Myxococcota bacterium]
MAHQRRQGHPAGHPRVDGLEADQHAQGLSLERKQPQLISRAVLACIELTTGLESR